MGVFDIFHINQESKHSGCISETALNIDETQMEHGCLSLVDRFYNDGSAALYEEFGIADRLTMATEFYDEVKQNMGIDAELSFVPMGNTEEGGYKPHSNTIELNSNLLERPDCSGLLNTILHESRHAFQMRAIEHPESVSVAPETISTWCDNFQNDISPELDYEEYRKQPVEADAFAYADGIVTDTSFQDFVA